MKELPKVYPCKISEDICNTQDLFYGKGERSEIKKDSRMILKKINDIFASSSHVYKSKVRIMINGENKEYIIVGKTNTQLITMDGNLIKITDIEEINKI